PVPVRPPRAPGRGRAAGRHRSRPGRVSRRPPFAHDLERRSREHVRDGGSRPHSRLPVPRHNRPLPPDHGRQRPRAGASGSPGPRERHGQPRDRGGAAAGDRGRHPRGRLPGPAGRGPGRARPRHRLAAREAAAGTTGDDRADAARDREPARGPDRTPDRAPAGQPAGRRLRLRCRLRERGQARGGAGDRLRPGPDGPLPGAGPAGRGKRLPPGARLGCPRSGRVRLRPARGVDGAPGGGPRRAPAQLAAAAGTYDGPQQLMASIGVMIEGQDGLNWERWRRLCQDAERLGFASPRRSDHLFSVFGVEGRDALDCWTSLALAAEWTRTIEFGPMVSSLTWHYPAVLARQAAAVDLLSDGRFILGVGAGWHQLEHERFGVPFPTLKQRMDNYENAIELILRAWERTLPKPPRAGRVPLLLGGGGGE